MSNVFVPKSAVKSKDSFNSEVLLLKKTCIYIPFPEIYGKNSFCKH